MARAKGKGKAKITTPSSSSDSTDASVPASPPPQRKAPLVIGKSKETPKKRTREPVQEKGTKKKKTSKPPVMHMERAIHEPRDFGIPLETEKLRTNMILITSLQKDDDGRKLRFEQGASSKDSASEPQTPAPVAPAKEKAKTAQKEQRSKQKEETGKPSGKKAKTGKKLTAESGTITESS
ncbi:uncharacterized protein LOC131182991 [Hevea brasiliensis]|uniref:uncharacterized protein LOC131182991 n=1 Tax=Hevea brasiliensis TaxID=3981 RepID=UPI0025D9D5EA|nr:uncharacterized protein LOC131182991 [Hevea brasiliensis]